MRMPSIACQNNLKILIRSGIMWQTGDLHKLIYMDGVHKWKTERSVYNYTVSEKKIMEFRFIPKKYLSQLNGEGLSSIPTEYIDSLLNEFDEQSEPPKLKEIDYAAGADYI